MRAVYIISVFRANSHYETYYKCIDAFCIRRYARRRLSLLVSVYFTVYMSVYIGNFHPPFAAENDICPGVAIRLANNSYNMHNTDHVRAQKRKII